MADFAPDPALVGFLGSQSTAQYTAGATIEIGDFLYLDPADNKYKPCDSSTQIKANATLMALSYAAADGDPFVGLVLVVGKIILPGANLTDNKLAPDVIWMVSENAGKMKPMTDMNSAEYYSILGISNSAVSEDQLIILKFSAASQLPLTGQVA